MGRAARIKDLSGVYHVMARSIVEFDMFQSDEDKEKFLEILLREKERYDFKIYAYCLMTNHYHIHIDPCGLDISKLMHIINLAYVRFINKKYDRRGPLLDGRFHSKLIRNDRQNLAVSAYIHLNPKDILEYDGREFEYPYSSMGIYLGKQKDIKGLVDIDFVLSSLNEDMQSALKIYADFVKSRLATKEDKEDGLKRYDEEIKKIHYEKRHYRHVIYRDKSPRKVIEYIAEKFGIEYVDSVMNKWDREEMNFRAVCAHVLLVYCGLTYGQICKIMCNLTESGVKGLCKKGFGLFKKGIVNKNLLSGLLAT